MGALKAPKVSKIERIVCWCHFTRLPKQNKVSYFKIFKVIKKKAEKTLFLFRIAPPHPIPYYLWRKQYDKASHQSVFLPLSFIRTQVNPPCFRLERQKYCVKRHWTQIWCMQWDWSDRVAVVRTYLAGQWFKVNKTDEIPNKPPTQPIQ